ncbi:hypothetical protein Q427_01125 [Halomonas sp. BC04]|nr:hypothetical protein Q427_01125 [Halomonas sp. BC04]
MTEIRTPALDDEGRRGQGEEEVICQGWQM